MTARLVVGDFINDTNSLLQSLGLVSETVDTDCAIRGLLPSAGYYDPYR